jgi:hypothetical protein
MFRPISRRQLLRGSAGAILGLPLLEAMSHPLARASDGNPPVRLVWIHTESGMWMPKYKPSKLGHDYEMTYILEPLTPFRERLSILSGLRHANAFKRNPQTGRHAQDGMCHLTGADLGGTPGVAVRNTVSVDQLAAEVVGEKTRLPVLNLSVDRNSTLSFTASGTPVPVEWDPRAIFIRLFANNSSEAKQKAAARFERNQSVLDDVLESTRELSGRLGANDRRTVEEYLTTVREVERRATVTRQWVDQPAVPKPPGVNAPGAVPENDRTAYVRVMLDMLALALQVDQTRLATARIGFMGCQYPDLGCPDSYHGYTHHDFKQDRQDAMAKVDRHRISHLAYFLERLNAIQEGGSTLLDACLIHYGAGMGEEHESPDLANLLIGTTSEIHAAGHVQYQDVPLANLYVRMLNTAGIPIHRFADSTGPLQLLS